jgi:folate-dependent phosphoribosylglycinamide formyltransferase PurN
MRVVICGANDLAGAIALNSLGAVFTAHQVILLLCDVSLGKGVDSPALQEFHYFMSDFPSQRYFPLIEKRPDGAEGCLLTPRELAKKHNAPLLEVNRQIPAPVWDRLVQFAPDVILSVRFLVIFKEPLLSLPRYGIYNIHSGELPSYGGILAPMRAMLNGESAVGATLHQVDTGIDTGPVVGVRHLEIKKERSLLWHFCHVYSLCVPLFEETLKRLENGREVKATAQKPAARRYYRFPSDEEIAAFLGKEYTFVQARDYAELLGRFINHS